VSTDHDPAAEKEAEPTAGPGRPAVSLAPEPGQSPAHEPGAGAATAPEGTGTAGADGGAGAAPVAEAVAVSEAAAELAAQRELRERIEQRRAERAGPIVAGTKLSGQTADLLAAVRAVESGEPVDPALLRPPAPAGPDRPRVPDRGPSPAPAATRSAPTGTVAAVREVLGAGGAPETLAGQVSEVLGERAADLLREDPWQLLAVPGVRPEQADGFARELLGAACGPSDERRAAALVGWLLERAALRGHTALEASSVLDALAGHGVPDPDEAMRHAESEGVVLVFRGGPEEDGGDAETAADDTADVPDVSATADAAPVGAGDAGADPPTVPVLLGLDRYALAEESLAEGLARLVKTAQEVSWAEAEAEAAVSVSPAAELIRAVAGHGLVLHSGGEAARAEPVALAGAARALGLRAVVAVHSENGRDRLAAPPDANPGGDPGAGPGRAPGTNSGADPGTRPGGGPDPGAGRSSGGGPGAAPGSGAGRGAEGRPGAGGLTVTVAGLLAGTEGPGRDADGALPLDLLVVLDAPQLDVETAAMIVESLPDGSRLVLSGDPGVLWSAGAGRVFADLLAARMCPRISSRTPDPGPIGELVSGIGVGELNQVAAPGREVVIVPVRDAGEAVHRTVQLVAESVPRAFGTETGQTQVITVGHGGSAGTRALNAALKQRLNPGPGRFGGFDPGDRIAYVPAPGRTLQGEVVAADAEGLRLDCAGATVVVPKDRVESAVRHGWALTAHQAAGMRWPAAVVVLPGDAARGLSRPWVYTAFSRGDRHLSVVHGADQALPHAVADVPSQERTTRLRACLETLLAPAARPG
jgi:hypothetical protein